MPQERLEFSTFGNLDEIIKVTNPKAWIALASTLFLLICTLAWVIFGNIPTKITGTGMLINISGIQTISAVVKGRISRFDVNIGDSIKVNQPVAYIYQPSLINDIKNQENKINEQKITNEQKELIRRTLSLKYQEELSDLYKKLEVMGKLLKSGAVLEKDAMEVREKITETGKKIDDLNIDRLEDENKLHEEERELVSLKNKYEGESVVRSPYNGHVVEISHSIGDVIDSGDELLTVESSDTDNNTLQAIIFMSAFEGKKVKPKMKVLISPSIVKPEEYGSMTGVVKSVSIYPSTFKSMMRIFHNEELVKHILSGGSQIEVSVQLESDSKTVSQYKWTSQNGPPIRIQSGTLCDAKIIVSRKRPIELIIPKIKKWLGTESE